MTELGTGRLGATLFALAHRTDRRHPRALFYYSGVVGRLFGPLAEWRFLCRHGELDRGSTEDRAHWLGAHAVALTQLRDFERAHTYMQRALELEPDNAWTACQQSDVLAEEDRRDEALTTIERALSLRPFYRPAVQRAAHLLLQMNHGERALELLRETAQRLESSAVAHQLLASLYESKRYDEALETLEEVIRLTPLGGENFQEFVHARRCDIAYQQGDLETAGLHAAKAGEGFFAIMAERLAEGAGDHRKVELPVEFIKQNFVTCAPATLAALCAYWSKEVDHEELAAEICYDGTADHVERSWAESHDFIAHEFKVTWEIATELLDRGIPFSVATGGATWGHIQGVIGYDALRRTLMVLEPGSYMSCEYLAKEWLERYESLGPRGMLVLPREESHRLKGLELPERELYHRYYLIKRALHSNERDKALTECRNLMKVAPGHRLSLQARWSISAYDFDLETSLKCVDALLGLYPEDARLDLCKVGLLRSLAHRDELRSFLEALAFRPGADPIFKLHYAEEIRQDARNGWEAEWLLRHVIRCYRDEAQLFSSLASLRWERGCVDEALELYRFATCLSPTDEGLCMGYFSLARLCKQTDEAVEFLRRRVADLGDRSGAPACTLYDCLTGLARNREAFQVLSDAIKRRPEDMQLVLFTAQAFLDHGRLDSAKQLLARSKQRAKRSDWLAVRAELARAEGDSRTALQVSLKLAGDKTYDVDLQTAAVDLLEQLEGPEEIKAQLETMVTRAPHYLPIQRLGIERLARLDREAAIVKLDDLLSRHPDFAWGQREIALLLCDAGRPENAKPHSERGIHLDPRSASSHGIHARVLRELGDSDGARASYQEALCLDADYGMAIHELIELAENQQERLAALDFVREQLKEQVVYGEGLFAYRAAARSVVDPDQVLPLLRETLDARPDLRPAWSETVQQLVEMGDLDAALELALGATERFPLVAETWFELANVQQSRRDSEGRIQALEQATALAASHIQGHCDLADAYQSAGRLDDAERVLVQLIGRAPRHTACYGFLADLHAEKGDYTAAVADLEKALRLEARYTWAWNQHLEWSSIQGRPEATAEFARTLTRERPEDAHAWLALVTQVTSPEAHDERITASERALELAPRDTEAHITHIRLLAEAGRFDEALESCSPAVFANGPPVELRGHAAWVLAERGQRRAAIGSMRAIVESDSSYLWGWQMLCAWYQEEGDLEKVKEACTWLTRLDPQSSNGWSNLAQCQLEVGHRDEAIVSLTKAMEREPEYGWASLNLFDLHLERGDHESAEQVLASMLEHIEGPAPCAHEVVLALKRNDETRARESFRVLCARSDGNESAMGTALDAYREAGLDDLAMQLLESQVQSGSCGVQAIHTWAGICLRRGDLESHRGAMEQAYALEPESEVTARNLADAYQKLDRFDDARRILDAALARTPDDPETIAYLADLQWETGEHADAIASMERALGLRHELQWCWVALECWGQSSDRPDLAREVARNLTLAHPKDLAVCLNWVHQCDFHDEGNERIEACRRALAIAPIDFEVHDLLIATLAEAGRLDDAAAACRPEEFGEEPPSRLRARAAWLHERRGDRETALTEMLRVAREFPQELFAWECLDDWYEQSGDHTARVHAATECASIFPTRADVVRRCGCAQEAAADFSAEQGGDATVPGLRARAKASYARALELAPGYSAAFCDAFDMHFAEGELDRAEALLTTYLVHSREEFGLARAVQLYALRSDQARAFGAFAELCGVSVEYSWPVQGAWEAMDQAGWRKSAFAQLGSMCERSEVGPQAAACYAKACAQSRRPGRFNSSLVALFQRGEVGVAAALAYLQEARASKPLEQIRKACGDLFRRETRVWAAYGEALMRDLRDREVCKWMGDWRNRPDTDGEALGTLAASLRRLDRWPQAARIAEVGLERSSGRDAYNFSLWLALDAALQGDAEKARALLDGVDPSYCNEYFDALRGLAEACLAAMGEGQPSPDAGFAVAKAELARVRPNVRHYHKHQLKCLSLAYARSLQCVASWRGGLAVGLWAWWSKRRVLA